MSKKIYDYLTSGDGKRILLVYLILFFFMVLAMQAQVQVEKTIPEAVELSDIREFVINVSTRTIDIHLENGKSYTLDRSPFMTFWNGLTSTQRNVIKGFIRECIKLAANVTDDKVTGDFGE